MGEDAVVAETDALDHGLLRLSARVVVPLTVRWDTAAHNPAAPPRDQRLQELLAVLRGVLRAHIAPTGGLDVAGAADAWCFVNAGDGHRFYYRFVEAPRFRVYTRASTHTAGGGMGEDGGTDTDAVYEACTVAARELVVLMTDDREPRDISDPAGAGAAGAVNVISRYFGLSFLCLLVDVCVCVCWNLTTLGCTHSSGRGRGWWRWRRSEKSSSSTAVKGGGRQEPEGAQTEGCVSDNGNENDSSHAVEGETAAEETRG